MSTILKANNLTKIFSLGGLLSRTKITAVDHVSFTVESSEIFTLAGESGCGKSTTARMILGFEIPTSGELHYLDQNIQSVKDKKAWFKEVQAVFQNPFESFNPLRKVESYFFETVNNFHIEKNEKRAEQLIEEKLQAVGLTYHEIAGKYPGELSGGQLQRSSIARSLLTNPSLLIADEPVSMVDASLRMSIVNLFREMRDSFGVSVIYITHDLATAYYISDRIAIMFRGNIVETGSVEEVLGNPKHPYTKLLIESIPQPDPHQQPKTLIKFLEEKEEYLRKGCKFSGRCPEVMDICKKITPKDVLIDGVMVKCHLFKTNTGKREE